MKQKAEEVVSSNSWLLYLDAMKSPLTRYKYLGNLGRFLDSTKVEGISLEDRANEFAKKGKKDTDWAFRNIAKFVHLQTHGGKHRLCIYHQSYDHLLPSLEDH